MSHDLDRKLKTSLDETRLLVLGAQVLLGFEFQAFFQDGFSELSRLSRTLCLAGLGSIILTLAFLVLPSMEHRLVEKGHASTRLIDVTSFCAALGLAFLALTLTLSAYVVIDRHFGMIAGISGGLAFGALASFAWLGFEVLLGIAAEKKQMERSHTPLGMRIEQLLTEARLIIPGAQALLGFQFVAMLTSGFDRLPQTSKIIHVVALGLIGINVMLLMTPAALHRLTFGGDDSESFLRIGSALVITAPLFLAAGIGAESWVVLQKVTGDSVWSSFGAAAGFLALVLCWYVVPLVLRGRRTRREGLNVRFRTQ
ncbi:MAG: hypothetical protein QOH32_501 [Bradyrhizobium sp.]|jgi:hypothetical protein|nr:hypothetical protein [Bradyrhizobium sp.]